METTLNHIKVYQKSTNSTNVGTAKAYADYDQLKYAFRSLEKYAPWLNRIWLVTNGQNPPRWLDTHNRTDFDFILLQTKPVITTVGLGP